MDVKFLRQGIWFVWDAEKAEANQAAHDVTFELATEVFFDPFIYTEKERTSSGEVRHVAIGLTSSWSALFVVHIDQIESVRIISARRATPAQRKRYENQ